MRLDWWRERAKEELEKAAEGQGEALEARKKAAEAYRRAERRVEEVKPVMDEIRHHREVNHFTGMFEEALFGKRRRR